MFHGPCHTFSQVHPLGIGFVKGKVGYRMPRGTGSQDKGVELLLLQIPDDLLTGFMAAQKGMFRTMPDR
jgi:hypothetical protein